MCIFLIFAFFVVLYFNFLLRCTVWQVELPLQAGGVSESSPSWVGRHGRSVRVRECMHSLAQVQALVWACVFLLFLSQRRFFYFNFSDINSDDLVLDHVTKLFIVLYRADAWAFWAGCCVCVCEWVSCVCVCVSGLWCYYDYDYSSNYFLSSWSSPKGQNERTSASEAAAVLEWHPLWKV